MATKQGLTASIYQQTEDAKRAIVSRSKTSSWFSNINTTCTIKSAPPRTPEVLQLLACQSGYLFKRNEQHVWQSRWCCIVPHHFLYYFDASEGGSGSGGSGGEYQHVLTSEQQDALNAAVSNSGRKQTQARSSLNIFAPTTTTTVTTEPEVVDNTNNASFKTLLPSGIIDLECYTNVHRSPQNPLLLELAGDESLNPELRSFYFVANDEETSEDWTRSILSKRHAALMDEREAYRQVCDGFAEQLQELHANLDDMDKDLSDAKDENYRIRSVSEETRRQILRKVQNVLERDTPVFRQKRREYRMELETVRTQDLGGFAAVQLLSDYTNELEVACTDWMQKAQAAQEQLQQGADLGNTRTKELEELLQKKEEEHLSEVENLKAQFQSALDRLVHAQTALQDKQQQAQSQKMEFTMYQSSMKAKLLEVNSHKKILKKEVIDLRVKLDEVGSELSLLKHNSSMSKEQVDIERRKSELLEKYVEKMESQVKVQQNMMEIMSAHSGYGSQYGAGSESARSRGDPPDAVDTNRYNNNTINNNGFGFDGSSPRNARPNKKNVTKTDRVVMNSPSGIDDEDDDDGIVETHSQMLRKAMADEDNKSHMSELTEDRTHRHLDYPDDVLSFYRKQMKPPPSYIGVEHLDGNNTNNNMDHRDTINSSAVSLPPTTRTSSSVPRPPQAANNSGDSVGSSSRLSVATRARQDAERGVTNRVRTLPSGRSPQKPVRSHSQPSFLASLSKQISEAIDNSVLGVPDPMLTAELYRSRSPESVRSEAESTDIGPSDVLSSASTNDTSQLSLSERQQLQRAKQIAFLKEQGLLKSENGTKGGAGGR